MTKQPETVTLHCVAGNHEWQRTKQRGRKPVNCPNHAPAPAERPKAERVVAPSGKVVLHCEFGDHTWERPSQRGRRPVNCPDCTIKMEQAQAEQQAANPVHSEARLVVPEALRKYLDPKYATAEGSEAPLHAIMTKIENGTLARREPADIRLMLSAARSHLRQATNYQQSIPTSAFTA